MTTKNASQVMPDLYIDDANLSIIIPRYAVRKIGYEFGRNVVVYLRRKHPALPLFVRPFYLACYTFFKKNGINPESSFARTHYQKNYYSFSNGKLRKNVKSRTGIYPYLIWSRVDRTYQKVPSTYYFVTARFIDQNSKNVNLGFTINASSLNVKIYVTKEFIERHGDPSTFDFPALFEGFLAEIGYHKAVYVISAEFKWMHRLHALCHDVKEKMMKGEIV